MFESTQIRPVGNKVLVKRHKMPETLGMILMPETQYEKSLYCDVIAVGSGSYAKKDATKRLPMSCEPGQVVLIRQWSGQKLTAIHEGETTELLLVEDNFVEGHQYEDMLISQVEGISTKDKV